MIGTMYNRFTTLIDFYFYDQTLLKINFHYRYLLGLDIFE